MILYCEGLVYTGSKDGYARCGKAPAKTVHFRAHTMPRVLCADCEAQYKAAEQMTTCPTCSGAGRVKKGERTT